MRGVWLRACWLRTLPAGVQRLSADRRRWRGVGCGPISVRRRLCRLFRAAIRGWRGRPGAGTILVRLRECRRARGRTPPCAWWLRLAALRGRRVGRASRVWSASLRWGGCVGAPPASSWSRDGVLSEALFQKECPGSSTAAFAPGESCTLIEVQGALVVLTRLERHLHASEGPCPGFDYAKEFPANLQSAEAAQDREVVEVEHGGRCEG